MKELFSIKLSTDNTLYSPSASLSPLLWSLTGCRHYCSSVFDSLSSGNIFKLESHIV